MKLYVAKPSPYARMVLVVISEKQLEDRVEVHAVDSQLRAKDSPYYAINPSGRVPFLLNDEGLGMEDSSFLCEYLDHIDGRPSLEAPAQHRWELRRLEAVARKHPGRNGRLVSRAATRGTPPVTFPAPAGSRPVRTARRRMGTRRLSPTHPGSAEPGSGHSCVCPGLRREYSRPAMAQRAAVTCRVARACVRSKLVHPQPMPPTLPRQAPTTPPGEQR